MKKAAYYVRVSTEKQKDEQTIEAQIMEIEKRAKEDGNVLLHNCHFEDAGWSGDILARPGLDLMRQSARNKEFDLLYVYDRGRLARRHAYQEIVIEEIEELGIEFVTLTEIKAITPEDKVLQSMQGVFHEYERIKIAERMRLGKIRKTKSGKLLGYTPPYGYDYILRYGEKEGSFVINEDEARIVRMIFQWVGEEEYTVRAVIRKLAEIKSYPRKEKRKFWAKSVIARMLRNTTYIGEHYYNKSKSVVPVSPVKQALYKRIKKSSRRGRPEEDWILCTKVPQIVSDELFEKVQKQIEINKKFCHRNKKHDYLLNGLVYCPCGHTRAGQPGGNHFYYRCTERIYNFPVKPKCTEKAVNANVLDDEVWKKLKQMMEKPEDLEKQVDRYIKSHSQRNNIDSNQVAELGKELKRLRIEEQRYLKLYGSGIVSIDALDHQLKAVKQNREIITNQISELEKKQSQQLNYSLNPGKIIEVIKEYFKKFNLEEKKRAIRDVIDKIVVNQEFALVTGHITVRKDNEYVTFKPKHRNRWSTKCRQINTF